MFNVVAKTDDERYYDDGQAEFSGDDYDDYIAAGVEAEQQALAD